MVSFRVHTSEDLSGQRPLRQQPGDLRSLTASQQTAMASYPILAATARLAWQIGLHGAELTADSGTLVARLLSVASEALEQLRDGLTSQDVLVQILVARVSLVARSLARRLRLAVRYGTQNGTTTAVLSQPSLLTLAQIEGYDPVLPGPVSSAFAQVQTLVTVLIDDLSFLRGVPAA